MHKITINAFLILEVKLKNSLHPVQNWANCCKHCLTWFGMNDMALIDFRANRQSEPMEPPKQYKKENSDTFKLYKL